MPADRGRWEGILAGEGGQGLVVGGIVLGEAAVAQGLEAVQSQWVLGSAARGSLSRSEVVISGEAIAFPRVRRADALVALTQNALVRHLALLGTDATVLLDAEAVTDRSGLGPGHRVHLLPILAAANGGGYARSVNMFAIGVLFGLLGEPGGLRVESLERAIHGRFGTKAPGNLAAFRAGLALSTGRDRA